MVVLPTAIWCNRPGLAELIDVLGGGEQVRLVGGAVRDGLLGLPVSDIDLATRLRPDAIMALLDQAAIKAVPTGLAHGTVTAVTGGGAVEITTLRRDVSTDGRHATVAFSDDWREDASRRDFTINALYADPVTGEVFDWFGGLNDLSARRVRFIGDPLTRIAEDHLRILRFFRFYARFGGGPPDGDALAACAERANDLMALSRERIAAELLKLLVSTDPVPTVELMIEHGIFASVLPEITDPAPLTALIARETKARVTGDPVRRLAALIAPEPALARDIGARLKLSKQIIKRMETAATRAHGDPDRLAYRFGREGAVDLILLGTDEVDAVATLAEWQRPQLSIGGGALIARGLPPGPVVARTLSAIETQWIEAGFPTGAALETIVENELSRAI